MRTCKDCNCELWGHKSRIYCFDCANRRNSERVKKRHIDKEIRLKVLKFFNYVCQICGKLTNPNVDSSHDDYPNLDHIVPFSICESNHISNLQCLCRKCNMDKRDNVSGTIIK